MYSLDVATNKSEISFLVNKVMKSFDCINERLTTVETTVEDIRKIVGEDPKLRVRNLSLKGNINSLNNNTFEKNNVFQDNLISETIDMQNLDNNDLLFNLFEALSG